MKKILLNMYLKKNLGDDLFLKIFAERYSNSKLYILPLCNYNKKYLNKNIIQKRNLITRTFNFLDKKIGRNKAIVFNHYKKKSDILVTLGGSMFIQKNDNINEYKNKIENTYYRVKKPYYIIGSNFGPYKDDRYYRLYKNVFTSAKDVCFREEYSFKLFSDLRKTRYKSDIVFSLNTNNYKIEDSKKIVISVIDLSNRNDISKYKNEYQNKIIEIIKYYQNKNYNISLMSFCDGEGDNIAIQEILEKIDNKNNITYFNYNGDIDMALNEISSCEMIVATRFHAMILGFVFNKKVLPIIYSKKMLNVIKDSKFDGIYVDISDIEKFDIKNDYKNISKMNKNMEKLKKSAEEQFKELDKVLL